MISISIIHYFLTSIYISLNIGKLFIFIIMQYIQLSLEYIAYHFKINNPIIIIHQIINHNTPHFYSFSFLTNLLVSFEVQFYCFPLLLVLSIVGSSLCSLLFFISRLLSSLIALSSCFLLGFGFGFCSFRSLQQKQSVTVKLRSDSEIGFQCSVLFLLITHSMGFQVHLPFVLPLLE